MKQKWIFSRIMSCSKPMLADDPWVGVPSPQRRLHWKILRRLVLEPGSGENRTIFRRERRIRIRMAAGWHPDWATKIAAACSDVLALLFTLLECFRPPPTCCYGRYSGLPTRNDFPELPWGVQSPALQSNSIPLSRLGHIYLYKFGI